MDDVYSIDAIIANIKSNAHDMMSKRHPCQQHFHKDMVVIYDRNQNKVEEKQMLKNHQKADTLNQHVIYDMMRALRRKEEMLTEKELLSIYKELEMKICQKYRHDVLVDLIREQIRDLVKTVKK